MLIKKPFSGNTTFLVERDILFEDYEFRSQGCDSYGLGSRKKASMQLVLDEGDEAMVSIEEAYSVRSIVLTKVCKCRCIRGYLASR